MIPAAGGPPGPSLDSPLPGINAKLVESTESDALNEYKKATVSLIEEYFSTGAVDAASSDMRQLGSNKYHPYFIKRLISFSMDRHDKEKEMAYVLLSALSSDVITPTSITQGFQMLLDCADDLAVDILDVVDILALFVARAVVDGILPRAFVTKAQKGFPPMTKGFLVLETAQKSYLSAPHHAELVEQRWGGSTCFKVEQVKKIYLDLLRGYVESGDTFEACRSIRQLGVAFFHHEVVKRALILALETHSAEPAILKLLKEAADEGLISSSQMLKGFTRLAESLNDLALYIPRAKTLFRELVPQAVTGGWLDASFLKSLDAIGEVHEKDFEKLKLDKTEAVAIIRRPISHEPVQEPDQLLESREDKIGKELSPITFLRKCKSQNLHKHVLEVFMEFIKARESPVHKIEVESFEALSCVVQGDLELEPNNIHVYEFLGEIIPSKEELQERRELIVTLTNHIREIWPNAKVVPYGSFGSGLSLKRSDIDLTIFKDGLFKDESNVWTIADSAENNELYPICQLMREKKMLEVQYIGEAKVPIVRFVNPTPRIDVDISLNGIDGFLNTKLLSSLQSFDQRIPNLCALVKNWARVNDLNKTRNGSLSSYSYNLMVINFCQMRGIALVLHHESMKTFKVKLKENICGFCEHNSGEMTNKTNKGMTLFELLKSFFCYWAREYNYRDDVVSVRMGKTISRKESRCAGNVQSKETIVIEDPFTITKNVCVSLKPDQLKKMRKEFAIAAQLLERSAKSWIDKYRPSFI